MNRAMKITGFTLVELMISVSIISVLTAIAIPNLVRSRMVANEADAVAALRTLAQAQQVYRRTDFDGDGVFEYAYYWNLTENWKPDESGVWKQDRVELISRDLAIAQRWGNPYGVWPSVPRAGYYFTGINQWRGENDTFSWNGEMMGNNWVVTRYGFSATPAAYGSTGVNAFAIGEDGVVWQKEASRIEGYINSNSIWELPEPKLMAKEGWVIVE